MSIAYLNIVAALFIPIAAHAQGQLLAFPGAEGFGRMAQGGRGGSVIEVTNLSDTGSGSLRAALNASGARTIVFRTGGIIDLQSELQIHNPFVTIAAQTAPGDGIVLRNFGLSIFTHDVIIRGLRIRPADGLHTLSPDNRDCLSLQDGAYNIMVDHCSLSWAVDENVNVWSGSHHVSLQHCIISEGLFKSIHPKGPHSMGMLVGDGSHSVSVHHNLFAHNNGRNPLFVGGTDLEFTNNLVYDWGYSSEFKESGAQIRTDIIGNWWKPLTGPVDLDELPLAIDFDSDNNLGSLLHIRDNAWPGGPFLTQQQIASFGANGALFPSSSVLSDVSTVTTDEVTEIRTAVPAWAGAIHPQRDATDLRILQQLADSTGGLLDCVRNGPIHLDSGMVISADLNSITYSLLDDAIKYSPEGRRIQITSGTGAGQIRTGLDVTVVDELNQVITSNVDAAWQEVPDATSHFRISAYCLNTLNGYPGYASGQPFTDTDHDGMPDDWELAQGLNPQDPSDRNGTDLSEENYTNLEVFLNGYYTDTPLTVDEPLDEAGLSIQPNPFSDATIIQLLGNGHSSAVAEIFSTDGRLVTDLDSNGNGQFMWNGTDTQGRLMPNGLYIVRIATSGENATGRLVLIR
jgi:pectate lyase